MDISVKKDGKSLVVELSGRLDTTTAPDLERTIKEQISGIENLTLDFLNLEYISSAGLRVLLLSQKTMNSQGKMKITNVNDDIREIFDITGFIDILTLE